MLLCPTEVVWYYVGTANIWPSEEIVSIISSMFVSTYPNSIPVLGRGLLVLMTFTWYTIPMSGAEGFSHFFLFLTVALRNTLGMCTLLEFQRCHDTRNVRALLLSLFISMIVILSSRLFLLTSFF